MILGCNKMEPNNQEICELEQVAEEIESMPQHERRAKIKELFPGWFGIEIPIHFSLSPILEIYIAEIEFRKSEEPEYTYGALLWGQPPGYLKYGVLTYGFKNENDVVNKGEMVQCLPIKVENGGIRYFPNKIVEYSLKPGPLSDFLYPSFDIIEALKEAKEVGQFNVHYSLEFEGLNQEEQTFIREYFRKKLEPLEIKDLSDKVRSC